MNELEQLLFENKYEDAAIKIKDMLKEDMGNSKLWYLLFLAQNNNYIDTNFEKLNNEIAFNKALELATTYDEMKYKMEFSLYKEATKIKGFSKFLRFYQYEKAYKCVLILKELNEKSDEIVALSDNFIDSIKYFFSDISNVTKYNLMLLALNFIYIISNNEKIKELIEEELENDLYNLSSLNPFVILNKKEFDEKIDSIIDNYNIQLLKQMEEDALNGNSLSCLICGLNYLTGYDGYNKDYEKAYNYLKKAYDLGNMRAASYLGFLYENGLYVKTDYNVAKDYYLISIENSIDSKEKLLKLYLNHFNTKENKPIIMEMFSDLLKTNESNNLLLLYGKYLIENDNDINKGLDIIKSLVKAKYDIAILYCMNLYSSGKYVDINLDLAFNLALEYKDVSESILASLGMFYYRGSGTKKDIDEAYICLTHAYNKGEKNISPYMLALIFSDENERFYDKEKAFSYINEAINYCKDGKKLYLLGKFYIEGKIIEKNLLKGQMLLSESMLYGYGKAAYDLGLLYYEGKEFEKNVSLAYELFEKAKILGYDEGINYLSIIENENNLKNKDETILKKKRKRIIALIAIIAVIVIIIVLIYLYYKFVY
ncbi:MAG: hypothetical protein K5892_03030 [Acholeplasmatales bacterium]|nr:hypothetical protein [Acholeplasmatales bacterium]